MLNDANSTLANAKAQESNVQNKLGSVNSPIQAKSNGLKLPTNYLKDLKNGTIQNYLYDYKQRFGSYVPNKEDNYIVNPSNLTPSQQSEITNYTAYTASLINQLRHITNEAPAVPNQEMINFVDKVAQAIYADYIDGNHDNKAISGIFQNDPYLKLGKGNCFVRTM